jgi:hypothetical protein
MFWLLLAGAGCALMIIGGGGVWMWAGIVAFTVSLGGFVRLNIRSVDRSNSQ